MSNLLYAGIGLPGKVKVLRGFVKLLFYTLQKQEICFITHQVGMMFYMFLRSHESLTERELPVRIVFPRSSLSQRISSKV